MIPNFENEWQKLKSRLGSVRCTLSSGTSPQPPLHMQELLIVGEDHRFRYHPGVDLIALCRAFWRTNLCGRREGGSTIAMQLVRVLSGRFEKSLSRKCLEIFLAVRLSRVVPKECLPALYLSVAYYGWRMNGFAQACDRLVLNPTSMTLRDAADLVARLKYPEPRKTSDTRKAQIEMRSAYLMRRYRREKVSRRLLSKLSDVSNGTIQSSKPFKDNI